MLAFVAAVIPTAGVVFLFWLGVRAMLQADRRERQAIARLRPPGGVEGFAGESGPAESNPTESNPTQSGPDTRPET